jgi:hypothetical protein
MVSMYATLSPPIEEQCPSPIVADQDHVFVDFEDVEQSLQILGMHREPVSPRPGGDASRIAHTDEVRSDAPTDVGQLRDHVAP